MTFTNDFVNELSIELKLEFPDMKGLSPRNLRRMKYKEVQNWPMALANLPWSHNLDILDKLPSEEEINMHINLDDN